MEGRFYWWNYPKYPGFDWKQDKRGCVSLCSILLQPAGEGEFKIKIQKETKGATAVFY